MRKREQLLGQNATYIFDFLPILTKISGIFGFKTKKKYLNLRNFLNEIYGKLKTYFIYKKKILNNKYILIF